MENTLLFLIKLALFFKDLLNLYELKLLKHFWVYFYKGTSFLTSKILIFEEVQYPSCLGILGIVNSWKCFLSLSQSEWAPLIDFITLIYH